MGHTYTNLSRPRGVPWLKNELKGDLFAYIGGTIKHLGGRPLIVGGFSDHVHLLFILPAQAPLSDVMEKVKANSSRWLHERSAATRGFGWQTGYTAFSVSQSSLEEVRQCIARQEEHHRKRSFRDELNALLRKHGIEPDACFED